MNLFLGVLDLNLSKIAAVGMYFKMTICCKYRKIIEKCTPQAGL